MPPANTPPATIPFDLKPQFANLTVRLLRLRQLLTGVGLLSLAACSSGPSRVHQPGIDADGAGELAMETYDTNADGKVAGDELEKAPGLQALLATGDTNQDGAISAEEVTARVNRWKEQKTGVTIFSFIVTLDGRPLEGASVVFDPEPFLGDEIKAGVGETAFGGSGGASIPKDQRPSPTSPPGMYLGLYKVRISKIVNGAETIPAKYNTETTLGQEVAGDVPSIIKGITYKLTS